MLLTDKQLSERMDWFIEKYEPYCCLTPEWKLDIPIIYSENPDETEKEHAEIWKNKLRELMWEEAYAPYIHRWGREDTRLWAQFSALWLYNGPIFKHINEKDA